MLRELFVCYSLTIEFEMVKLTFNVNARTVDRFLSDGGNYKKNIQSSGSE